MIVRKFHQIASIIMRSHRPLLIRRIDRWKTNDGDSDGDGGEWIRRVTDVRVGRKDGSYTRMAD